MTSRAEPRLPDCIQADWADVLDGLPSPWQRWGWELVQSYLPPLCVDALAFLDIRHTADGGGPRPGEQPWDDLLTPDGVTLTQAVPGRIWMSHPLFMAIYGLFHADRPGHLQARNLLVRYLADLDAPEDTQEAPAYYDDALALRRCLQTLAKADRLAELTNPPDLGDLIQALDALPEQALKERGLPDKIQTVRALTEGKRYLGTRQFHQANRRTTTRLPRRHLTRATPGSRSGGSRRSRSESQETGADPSEPVIAGRRYQRKAEPGARGKQPEPADPDTPISWQRAKPSTLTPADDWLTLRRSGGMPPTATVPALTDPASLPTPILVKAFNVLADGADEAWALAWLVVTTGMAGRRLTSTEEATAAPTPDWRPQWHPDEQLLCYRLRDGPAQSVNDPTGANQVVALPLPEGVQQALARAASPRPLAEAGQQIPHILSSAFRPMPGPTPSLSRLRASAWAWIRPRARDPVAAATLSGQFGVGLASQAAYRALDGDEIATLFRGVNQDLAGHLDNAAEAEAGLKAHLATITYPMASPTGPVGSNRYCPFGTFGQTLDLLYATFAAAGEQARAARGDPDREARALQYLVNIQALYGYVGWLLATGARPIGRKTAFQPLDWAWFLADKASTRYQEARALPPIPPVRTHLDQAAQDRDRVLRHVGTRGWETVDRRKESQQALPALLTHHRGRTFRIQAVYNSDFETWMARLDLDAFMPTPVNAARHTVATYLRGRVPASLVDAFLGHHGHGADRLGPASSVAVTAWQPLVEEILAILHRVGFKALGISEVWR